MSKTAADISVHWRVCGECHTTHPTAGACPPIGVWLVPALCQRCDPDAGRFCAEHWRLGVDE